MYRLGWYVVIVIVITANRGDSANTDHQYGRVCDGSENHHI